MPKIPIDQPALPMHDAFTAADLAEWTADVEASRWDIAHVPNEWARAGLGSLLGEEIPYRVWGTAELLNALRRAASKVGA